MAVSRDDPLSAFVAASPIVRRPIRDFVGDFAHDLEPGTRVLDVGAGEAPYRRLFSHCRYETHDWPGSVHPAAQRATYVSDLRDGLPVGSGSVDAVLLTEVLEHLERPLAALQEVRRILRPGGMVAITVPFVAPLHEEPRDYQRLTAHGLRDLLSSAGFGEIEVRPMGGWFTMLANLFREQGLSTQLEGAKASPTQRAVSAGFRLLSRLLAGVAPRLDRSLDRRVALPLGWTVRGVA
jgi:SAM-dependent methyltransferase